MKGKNIEVISENSKTEIQDIEHGVQIIGDVKIMIAGFYFLINTTDFLIKWDGGSYFYNYLF